MVILKPVSKIILFLQENGGINFNTGEFPCHVKNIYFLKCW